MRVYFAPALFQFQLLLVSLRSYPLFIKSLKIISHLSLFLFLFFFRWRWWWWEFHSFLPSCIIIMIVVIPIHMGSSLSLTLALKSLSFLLRAFHNCVSLQLATPRSRHQQQQQQHHIVVVVVVVTCFLTLFAIWN